LIRYFLTILLLVCGNPASGQTIALVADMNGRYGSTSYDKRVDQAFERIVGQGVDAVVCAGDMVAGQKQPKLDAMWLDSMWASFNDVVHDPLTAADIPFFPSAGNHDGSGLPGFALERERFNLQWQQRRPEVEFLPGSEWPRRYAARLGDVLLLTFDGTIPGKLPPAELRFIERMLAAHSSRVRATVVFSHLPIWPFTQGREDDILEDSALLQLLHRNGVDVFVSGHHHAYYAGIDVAGMLHVSVGALGGNVRPLLGQRGRQSHSFALLEIGQDAVTVQSRLAREFTRPVPPSDLPGRIAGPLGTLQRVEDPIPLRP
jgi:predicted phosphodiesterase